MFISSCQSRDDHRNNQINILSNFSELQSIIDAEKERIIVLNFWATSCPPCIKEMPHFNHLFESYKQDELRILLVSLDEIKYLEPKVVPFVAKHKLKPEVFLLKDQNYSAWTDKIDSSWYGALPATIIIKGDERKFKFGIYESFRDLQDDILIIHPTLK